MKPLFSLATIGMLLIACKLCGFTSDNRNPTPSPTPTPRPQKFVADIFKPKLGSFTLVKSQTKEEITKKVGSERQLRNLLEQSNDSGLAAYRNEKEEPVLIWIFSFPTPEIAATSFEEFGTDMRGSRRWRNVKTSTIEHGKRIEGTDSKSRAVIVWTNNEWLFWVWSSDPALSESFAQSVGY